MSQFPGQFEEQPAHAQPETSKLAISSLVCALIFFCPITTLLAPLLGLGALVSIGGNPARKGKGMAIVGILLGVLFTAGWGVGGFWAVGKMKEVMAVVMEGPNSALAAGFGGDIAGFKDGFYGDGASASDADATAFIEELRSRYGAFSSASMDTNQTQQPTPGQPSAIFPYDLQFESGTVSCTAEIIFADQQTGAIPMKLGYITVVDAERGDLTYPPPSSSGG